MPALRPKSTDKNRVRQPRNKGKMILLLAAAAALILSAIWFVSCRQSNDNGDNKVVIPSIPSSGQKEGASQQSSSGSKSSDASASKIIKSVKILPQSPVVSDTLKVELSVDNDRGEVINYKYLWIVNNKIVPDSDSEMLKPGSFKKGDIVSVRVVPYKYGAENPYSEALPVLIQNSAPALDMRSQPQKAGVVIEIQLVASDPDGDKAVFALEEPRLEGMTIDKETGKITFIPKKIEKGVYKFKASVSDNSGGKTTREFEIKIEAETLKK